MKKYIYFCVLFVSLTMNSCSNFVDGYELSPNDPTESTPALLTTVTEVATFSHYTGQFARMACVMTQQCNGVQAQYEDLANYVLLEGDNVNEWESHYSAMLDAQQLIDLAGDENPWYRGIGRVLKAMNIGLTTDLWGDVPYTQALKGLDGEEAFNPAYDSQESIYAAIQQLLSDAITDFGQPEEANATTPFTDDLIYDGDPQSWIAAAWVLKARYAIHLTNIDEMEAASDALTYVSNAYDAGMESPADDMNAIFPGAGNSLNQWYAFQQTRADYLKMGVRLVDHLESIDDPRLPFYATTDASGGYSGAPLGSTDFTASDVGAFFASPDSDAPMVTYVEAKFIEAEAAFRTGDADRAATAYNEAVIAHIMHVTGSAPSAAYIADQANETAASITLEMIMTQKYIAMFTQFEVYNDWRRTGIPMLTPNPEAAINAIPVRLPTPQTERLYNSNAVVISNILQPIWWDE